MARLRVYVAGAYSGPDCVTIFGNMRRGIKLSYRVLEAGMAPFCPWLDYHFSLEGEVSLDDYLAYSLAWMEVADAVLTVPVGLEQSKGSQAEIARARELGIPVFGCLADLQAWASAQRDLSTTIKIDNPTIAIYAGLPHGGL